MNCVNFVKVTGRSLWAVAGLAAGLVGLSLILTIAGNADVRTKHERTRGHIWATEREMLLKRLTLKEINRQIGSEGKKVTNSGTAVYVWHDLVLPDVVITGTFADDGRLSYFKRVSHPNWRSDTGTYSIRDQTWAYSESKDEH
jgi:hypothetical protein